MTLQGLARPPRPRHPGWSGRAADLRRSRRSRGHLLGAAASTPTSARAGADEAGLQPPVPSGPGDTPRTPDTRYARFGKPLLDRVVGLVALILLAPLIAAVALAVAASLGRPLLYRHARVGIGGRPFEILKFRTMRPDRRRAQRQWHDRDRRRTHKSADDPRHVPVGRLLRRFSLDELPQLWNVVRGDMSLVGPRPELVDVVRRYEPWQHRRHAVRPGITGLWQVTDRASGELMLHHTATDLRYVEDLSLATDVRILARTLPAAVGRGGR